MTNYLRPDEMATESLIRKNQEEEKRFKNVGKTALAIGATAGLGPIAGRIAPFLNKFIPADLAIKGISKVAPQLGNLLKKGQSYGLDMKEGLDFIKDQFMPKAEPAKENRNIIQQVSPELHQFLDQEIKKGRKPIEAGALAQNDKRFGDIIKKLMKAHKTPWSSIVESIFGNGQMAQPSQQSLAAEAMQPPGSLPQQPPSAEAQAAMQKGQGLDPAVAKLVQDVNARLQTFRGGQ